MSDQPAVPAPRSDADAALDRVIAAKPVSVPAPPSDLIDPAAHRRGIARLRW
jgi:hypothetical protein